MNWCRRNMGLECILDNAETPYLQNFSSSAGSLVHENLQRRNCKRWIHVFFEARGSNAEISS